MTSAKKNTDTGRFVQIDPLVHRPRGTSAAI